MASRNFGNVKAACDRAQAVACDRAHAVKAGDLLLGPLSRQQERMDRRLPVRTYR